MLRNRKAILPFLIVIFTFLFDISASSQCGAGKLSREVQGFGSIITTDNAYGGNTGSNALGVPDGNGAYFSNSGQYIIIDLLDTVRAGQTYSFIWRQFPGIGPASQLWWSESVDGSSFVDHPLSGTLSTTNERYFITDINAATDTRYIRITMLSGTNDFNIDAISYYATKCYSDNCGAGFTSQLISGNPTYFAGNSINDPTYANFVPDGRGAFINTTTDFARFRLPSIIPAGQDYYIIWRPEQNGAQIRIRESSDGTTWSGYKYTAALPASSVYVLHVEKASISTGYIEISPGNSNDLYLDAIVFNAISCTLPPPDLDVEGSYTYCGSPISIAPGLVLTDPNNQIINGAYVQVGTNYISGQDRLECTVNYGITANWNAAFGVLYLSGQATVSQYESVLRTVTYRNLVGTPPAGLRRIVFSLERYNLHTDHYYRFVSNPNIRWPMARLDASRANLYGMQGYLVTINSDEENDFLLYQMSGNAWIGGSDFYYNSNDWYWMSGPESGTMFWQGEIGGTELTYANWNPGTEPNNYNGNDEVFAHIYPAGSANAGTWNDEIVTYNGPGYYVEFGGMPGDPTVDLYGIVDVSIDDVPPALVGTFPSGQTAMNLCYGAIPSGPSAASIAALYSDNCGGPVTVTKSGTPTGNDCAWSVTYTYTVRDWRSNYVADVPTVTYSGGDQTPPTLTGVFNWGATNMDLCFANIPDGPTAEEIATLYSDNCGGGITVVKSGTPTGNDCNWSVTYSYTVRDKCNNYVAVVPDVIYTGGDQSAPVITGNIAAATVEGCTVSAAPEAVTTVLALEGLGLAVSDNCTDDGSLAVTSSDSHTGSCPIVITRIYTITDACGNSINVTQTITVDDTTNPTASNPAPVTVQCTGDVPAPDITVVTDESDNCTVNPVVAFVSDVSDGNTCPEVITRTYSVTDACGNSINVTQTITVDDTTAPVITGTIEPTTVEGCDVSAAPSPVTTVAALEAMGLSISDNCTADQFLTVTSSDSDNGSFPIIITRTYRVTDACSNFTEAIHIITIDDKTDPTITCPADIIDIPADAGECYATGIVLGVPVTADNCGVAGVTNDAPAQFPAGITTVTWTVTDIHGNTATCEQLVTVIDTEFPTFTAPGDITIYKDATCGYDASPDITGDVTNEADNCDTSLDATYTDIVVAGACEGEQIITRTWSLSDDYGNTTTHDQIITVEDNTAPTFTVPADITIYKDATCGYDASVGITGDVTDEADNCDTSLDATFTDAVVPGTCEGEEIITRTWTLTDDCGNPTTHIQIIAVRDTTPPTFTVPADITIYKDAMCGYDASLGITGDVTDEADNCDTSLDATYTDVVVAGACEGEQIITRTWTLTDDCGNTTTHDQIITATDNTSPEWTTLPGALDVILECSDTDGLAAAQALFPVATDNCDNTTSDIIKVPGLFVPGPTCPQAGSYTNTWTVTDDCGNVSATYTQTITIVDLTAPTFTVPADITIYKDATCGYDASVGITGDVTDEADNCDTSLDATFIDAVVPGACEGEEIITRTWTLTDDCGNLTTHIQIITVRDTTPPTFTVPADITIYKDATCGHDASVGITGDVTDEADNCDTSLDATFTDAVVPGACEGEEIITRTWTLTDDCGNLTTHIQIITVRDTTPPTFTVPADITIYKDATCGYDSSVGITGDVTDEADNCDTSLDATFTDAVAPGTCEGEEIITRTWTLTDDCGNLTTHIQIITVRDTTPPTFTVPADITIYKDATCGYDSSVGITGDVTDEADNCDTSLDATFTDAVVPGTCEGEEIITRTWTLTDDCGNLTTHIQIITVRDTTPPTFTVPADITIYKDATCGYDASVGITGDVTDEADNCDTSLDATFTDAVAPGTCEGEEIITRTWTLTDDCGNVTTHIQIITVRDTTPPTFTVPADITIYKDATCGYDASVGITGDVTDEADNCDTSLDATFTDAVAPGTCEGEEIITRTWTLTDDCGNVTTHIQIITVRDTTPPTFTVPADITIYKDATCGYDSSVGITGDVTDEADNCDTSLDATFTDAVAAGACEGEEIITRTWTLTDDCGNLTTHIQIITVRDTTPPTFTVPADITIYKDATCGYDSSVGITGDVTDEADNCDTSLDATFTDAVVPGACEGEEIITRTWTLTDDCGNLTTHIQIITVRDTTPPTFTVPADITIYKDATCGYDSSVGITGDVTDEADNCDTSLDATFTDAVVPGACEGEEIITRTWTLTDDCGNLTTHIQIITVRDTTPPTFTVPAEITICRDVNGIYDRDPANTGDVTDEADNCDTSLDATYADSDVNMGTISTVGYITRTWALTDDCGNITTHDQIIWVQPVPRISVDVPDTLFCNGSTVSFTIDSLVISRGEVMYDLDVTYPAGVTGILSDGSRPIVNIEDLLTNSTDSYQTVIYTFRPYIQGKPGDPTCHDGIEITIVIHIEPTARVALTLADDELCNGESVNISISTITTPYRGIEFNVDAINSYPEIGGFTDRTGLIVTDIITEALTNSGDTARMVTYVVSPVTLDVNGNQKCYGVNDTVEVWVNPTPRATPVNNTPQICYGDATDIILLTPTVMRSGVNEFNYTISATASTAIVGGNRTPVNSIAPGTHLQFPYTNESDTMQSVFFHITPKVTGPGCPYGPEVVSEVKVHAHPLQSLEIRDSITCDGGQDGALEIFHARGMDPMWVAWTGPDYWEDAGYNMYIVDERSQGYYTATVTDELGCVNSAWLNLIEPNTEVAFYFDNFVSCPGAGDARIALALTDGGAPPYTYYLIRNMADTVYQGLMPPEDTFFHLDNIMPGDYLLIVEDANGCKLTEYRTLYDAPETIVRFGKSQYSGYNISCDSYNDGSIWVSSIRSYYMAGADSVFVTTRAPYTYLWTASDGGVITGSATDSILVNVPAGTYHLTVTDALGCEFHFTDTLSEPDGIDMVSEAVSTSPDGNYEISCFGRNDGYITLEFDGGAGAYSYAWTGPNGYTATTASIASLTAGSYELTVTDGNSCHKIYPYLLEEPDSVGITVVRSETPDGLFNIGCNGEDGTVDITVSGGSGPGTYTYNWKDENDPAWSSSSEDQTIKAGIYRVYVTDANGCTNDRGVVMTEPAPLGLQLAVSEITCLAAPSYNDGAIDLTITGGKSPYNIAWEGPSGFTSATEDIAGLTAGDYRVTVTDFYGCTISADTVLNMPEALTIDSHLSDYNGFNISCLGRSDGWIRVIPLTGTGPYDFTWSGPGGFTAVTDSISGLISGVYTVTVTDRHMCSVTENITLDSPGQLSMTLNIWNSAGGGFNIDCNGGSTGRVDITAVNAAGTPAYLWSDGLAGASRNDLSAGLHEVILIDGNGCMADTSFTLTQPDSLVIYFSMVSPYCPESNDGTLFAGVTGGEGAYSFIWSNGQTTQEATGLTAGLYRVEARDFNGCTVKDSASLAPLNEICVGIPNAFSPDGDGINEYWNIDRIALYSEAEVIILNRWGEVVWESAKGYPDPWDGRASNGKALPMDSYHYAIDLHNGEKPIVGHVTIIR